MAPALLRHQFENDAGFAVTFDAEHDAFIDPLNGGYVCTLPLFRDGPPISGVSEIGVVSCPSRQQPTWVAGPGIHIHFRAPRGARHRAGHFGPDRWLGPGMTNNRDSSPDPITPSETRAPFPGSARDRRPSLRAPSRTEKDARDARSPRQCRRAPRL